MKIYSSLARTLVLLAFIVMCAPRLQASMLNEFLEKTESKFDKVTSSQKYSIVSQPLNLKYLKSISSLQDLNDEQLRANVSHDPLAYEERSSGRTLVNSDKTTAITLAVSLGKLELVNKFLSVIGDINNPELTGWGYRQPYTLAHMALDPQYPKSHEAVTLETRLAIIDALARKGIDFNAVIQHSHIGIYKNPPLAAGDPSGHQIQDLIKPARARAMLYGADPQKRGSSFDGIKLSSGQELMNLCLDYYIDRLKAGAKLSPTPYVMQHIQETAIERGFDLEGFSKKVHYIQEIEARKSKISQQLQANNNNISALKAQKTKKAKRKVQHLLRIEEELQAESEALSQKVKVIHEQL